MTEIKAPEGGRPVSEMQRKIAQAIYDAPTTFDGDQIAVHLGLSMHIDEAVDSVEKAKSIVMQVCMDAALAAMKAMREPTVPMALAADDAILEQHCEHPLWAEAQHVIDELVPARIWASMLDAEISIAEGGSNAD